MDRRNAVTVQLLCLALTAVLVIHLVADAVQWLPVGATAYLRQVPADLATLTLVGLTWCLIRRGATRPAFAVLTGGMVVVLAVSLVARGYHFHQLFLLRTFGVVLALPALLLGRRALWASATAIALGCALGTLRDHGYLGGHGPLPMESSAVGILGSTLLTMAVFVLVMDRFGSTLREAFTDLLDRQNGLEAAAAELARKNRDLAEEVRRRQETEAQLVEAQKLKAIGELSAGVAHDFNNLLTGVIGFADLAIRGLPADSPVAPDLDEIRRAAQRGARLTGQLLAFARRQDARPSRIHVETVVAGMTKLMEKLLGDADGLRVELSPTRWTVCMDPSQLEQVLMNLIVNARDATAAGGTVTVTTGHRRLDTPLAGLAAGDYVALTVTDTGSGMDEATRLRVFEPFYSTKPQGQGTGLGLAVCHGLVHQAGGAIQVLSQPGAGSSFEVLLPRVAGEPEADRATAVVPGRGGGETILVVDDDLSVRATIVRSLRDLGYDVFEARDPDDAVAVLRAHASPVHLVLTDVIMPGGGGPALVARLRRIRPGLRVLLMSGFAGRLPGRLDMVEAGGPMLGKPFTTDELDQAIRAALAQPAAAPAGAPAPA
jgi:signal transduction histidine kinase/ActR/RegA family two-component response regulator